MTANQPQSRPWSAPVAVEDVPETGRQFELVPDADIRTAVAKLAGVRGLSRLAAGFDLTRHGSAGLRVVGTVSATVDQACVVTLETIQSEVKETIDLLFTSEIAMEDEEGPPAVDAGDPPERMRDGIVDLGALATEFLLLGIDPYPRKPGAKFDAPPAGEPANSPFAALASLNAGRNQKGQ